MLPAIIMGLAAPFMKDLAGTFMDAGLNLVSNAITGGGKKAKEYIEEKTGISLKDPSKLSGDDMAEIAKLEADPEAAIKLKELSLEFLKEESRHEEATDQNWEDRLKILADADATGNSIRPWGAKMFIIAVFYAEIVAISAWAYAVIKTPESLSTTWPLLLAIIGPPLGVVRSYFGMRTKEKKARYDMTASIPPKSIVKDIIGAFKKEE